MDTAEKMKKLKQSFRLYMNGVASNSMRQKGLNYKVNWGISQVDLRNMALDYGKDKDLGELLWREQSRECRLLATLIMPTNEMTIDMAMDWAGHAENIELAESLVFNLFQYMSEAKRLAVRLLNADSCIMRLCAYNLMCRLLRRSIECSDELYVMVLKKAAGDIKSDNRQLLHAVLNCLNDMAALGDMYAKKVDGILNELEIGAF